MLRIGAVVLNVSDTARAASFWREALEYESSPENPAFLVSPSGDPRVHLDDDDRTHLDLWTDDEAEQLAEVERLVALGAQRVDDWEYPQDADFIVLTDPEGNLFCVINTDD